MSTTDDIAEVAIDLHVLATLMRADGITVEGKVTATRIGRGQSNLTYLLEDAESSRWVARRPPLGSLLESAHDVQRESRILTALLGTCVPVPSVVRQYADQRLAETPVVVMEHVEGLVLDQPDIAECLSMEVRRGLGPAMAGTLARIHDVDLGEVGLDDLASHAPYAPRQLKRWSRQWEASRTRELPALESMTELLRRTMPEQRDVTLLHGDFHLRNVIVDPTAGNVSAVLDWELSTLGDPLADVGSLLAYWPEATDAPTGLFSASSLPGFSGRKELAEAYLSASGRDGSDLDYWHVLGLWKIAVIAEGVLQRAMDDPRNVAEGDPPRADLVDRFVDRAWEVAREAGLDR